MMKRIDYFIPTRIVFGAGRLKELATLSLPGKKYPCEIAIFNRQSASSLSLTQMIFPLKSIILYPSFFENIIQRCP